MSRRTARVRLGAHVGAVIVLLSSILGVSLVLAPPASAAGTFTNPGNWTMFTQAGVLQLAGRGSALPPPIAPPECSNGTNDDESLTDPNMPPVSQDFKPDWNAVVAESDPECVDAADNSEIMAGSQPKVIQNLQANINANGSFASASFTFSPILTYISQPFSGPVTIVTYFRAQTGTATSGAATTLTDTGKAWTVNQWAGHRLRITAGPGIGLVRNIVSNTATTLTVDAAMAPLPGAGSAYSIDNTSGSVPISSGSIDPASGAGTASFVFGAALTIPLAGQCFIDDVNVVLSTANAGGSNYDPDTGMITLSDPNFVLPASTGGTLCGTVNGSFGLPAAPGASVIQIAGRMTPSAGNLQPTAIAPPPPVGATEGVELTLNPSATDPDQVLCDTALPCPTPEPQFNWRWTQTGGPTISHIDVEPAMGNATFVPPDNGNYSFLIEVGDGASGSVSPNSATLNFSVGETTPVVNAGPDIEASAGVSSANNPIKLNGSASFIAPSDAVGAKTINWTNLVGGTCPASSIGFTTANALVTAFSTAAVGADCTQFVRLAAQDEDGNIGINDAVVTIRATTAAQIKGTITGCNPGCAPAQTALVSAYDVVGSSLNFAAQAYTDASGNYTITGLTNGNDYRLKVQKGTFNTTWLFGAEVAQSGQVFFAPYAGASATIWGGSGRGNLSGTVSVLPSGTAPDGTRVRLYAASGRFVRQALTSGGNYSFNNIAPGDYKVLFGFGTESPVDYAEVWADQGTNVSTATPKPVTSGNTTDVDATLTTADIAPKTIGAATSGTGTTLTETGKGWTVNQWQGYRLVIFSGTGVGQSAPIMSNTPTVLTVNQTLNPAPNATSKYMILPDQGTNGVATSGTATTVVDTARTFSGDQLVGMSLRIIAGAGAGQARTITTATANTLTVSVAFAPIPASGSVYVVETARTEGGAATAVGAATLTDSTKTWTAGEWLGSRARILPTTGGASTGVTATTLTDTTKAWGVNQWAGYRVRITTSGKEQSVPIVSNTATVLTVLGGFSSTPALVATNTYVIDPPVQATAPVFANVTTSATATTLTRAGQTWTPNQWVGYQVRLYTGPGGGTNQTRPVLSNTADTITVATPYPAAGLPGVGTGFALEPIPQYQIGTVASNTTTQLTTSANWAPAIATGNNYVVEPTIVSGEVTAAVNSSAFGTPPRAYLEDANRNWTTDQFVGYQLRIITGKGVGTVRTVVANGPKRIELDADFSTLTIPNTESVYMLSPPNPTSNGNLSGGVSFATTGQVVPNGLTEVRAYDGDTGGFVGKVKVGENIGGNFPLVGTTGSLTAAGTGTVITNTGAAYVAGSLAGYKIRFTSGPADGDSYTISTNTSNSITTSSTMLPLALNTNTYVIDPPSGAVNYSFWRWTADPAFPNAQAGLAPGSYTVMFRVIGTGGATPALCTAWNANVRGGPASGSYRYADPIDVLAGANTPLSAQLFQSAGCTTFN